LNKTTLAWTDRASAALTGGDNDMVSVAFPLLSGARILVYTNGVDAIRKYEGGADDAVLGGTPPISKFALSFGPYLILAYVTDGGNVYPWRVQWCDTGNPEEWSANDAGSVNLLEDSGDITGVGYYGPYVTIHKDSAIYVGYLTGTSSIFRFERK
jgi:hypothetical protein